MKSLRESVESYESPIFKNRLKIEGSEKIRKGRGEPEEATFNIGGEEGDTEQSSKRKATIS